MAGCEEGREVVQRREGVGTGRKSMSETEVASTGVCQTQAQTSRTPNLYVLCTLCLSMLSSRLCQITNRMDHS